VGLESPQAELVYARGRGAAREKMSGERILFAGESLLAHALRETAVSCFAGILKVLV